MKVFYDKDTDLKLIKGKKVACICESLDALLLGDE